jgi:hypothetical protein
LIGVLRKNPVSLVDMGQLAQPAVGLIFPDGLDAVGEDAEFKKS